MKFLAIILFTLWLCVSCGAQEPTPAQLDHSVIVQPQIVVEQEQGYGVKGVLRISGLQHIPNVFAPGDSQARIQAALDRDGYAYLLPGTYTLRETLTLPKRYGCALIGMGGSSCHVPGGIHPGLISNGAVVLKWAGAPGEPMVRVRGAEWRLDGCSLHGPASIGLLVENDNGGMGTGKGYVPSLTVCGCEVGVQFGKVATGDNGDVSSFGRLTAYDCGTVVRVIAPLGFELHFGYVRNARCPVVFDCRAGGGLHCYGGQTLERGGTVLRLGAVNPTASRYTIRGWHVDAPAAASGFKILECVDRSWADVTAEVFLPQLPYPTPIAKMIGPVSLKLERCSNLRPSAVLGIGHAAGTPVVIADGCRLRGKWDGAKLLTGEGMAVMRDCFDNRGVIQ